MIQIGGVYTTFCQEEGILFAKVCHRNGRCIAILFKSIGVRGVALTLLKRFASEFQPPNLKQKAANEALRRNSLANANGFASEMAKITSSLRKFLANGRLRQNSLAIANAMAWCTQMRVKKVQEKTGSSCPCFNIGYPERGGFASRGFCDRETTKRRSESDEDLQEF